MALPANVNHVNEWTPDTCGCVVYLAFDHGEPEDVRQHHPVACEPCKHHRRHAGLSGSARTGAVDTWTKANHALRAGGMSMDDAARVASEAVGEHHETARRVHAAAHGDMIHKNEVVNAVAEKHGMDPGEVRWSHDRNRKLRVHLPDLPKEAKKALRADHPDVTIL